MNILALPSGTECDKCTIACRSSGKQCTCTWVKQVTRRPMENIRQPCIADLERLHNMLSSHINNAEATLGEPRWVWSSYGSWWSRSAHAWKYKDQQTLATSRPLEHITGAGLVNPPEIHEDPRTVHDRAVPSSAISIFLSACNNLAQGSIIESCFILAASPGVSEARMLRSRVEL